jgi:hypothetical protein
MEQQDKSGKEEEGLQETGDRGVALLPDNLFDFLDPDQIKKALQITSIESRKKTRDELLEYLLDEANAIGKTYRGVKKDIRYEQYQQILPDLPSVDNPRIKRISDNQNIRDLDVDPSFILGILWKHCRTFHEFQGIKKDSIPDHIYQNLFEVNPALVTVKLNYRPRPDSLPEWLRQLYEWYGSSGESGWNALFVDQQEDASELLDLEEKIFHLAVCLVIFYYAAKNYYGEFGKDDLTFFWKLSLEQRQGEILDGIPDKPEDRFVWKYMRVSKKAKKSKKKLTIEEEEDEPIPDQPVIPPDEPIRTRSSKKKEIYYIYLMSAHAKELKKILQTRELSDAIEYNLGQEHNMNLWRISTGELLRNAQMDMRASKNHTVIRLMNVLTQVWTDFGGM